MQCRQPEGKKEKRRPMRNIDHNGLCGIILELYMECVPFRLNSLSQSSRAIFRSLRKCAHFLTVTPLFSCCDTMCQTEQWGNRKNPNRVFLFQKWHIRTLLLTSRIFGIEMRTWIEIHEVLYHEYCLSFLSFFECHTESLPVQRNEEANISKTVDKYRDW